MPLHDSAKHIHITHKSVFLDILKSKWHTGKLCDVWAQEEVNKVLEKKESNEKSKRLNGNHNNRMPKNVYM